MPYYSQLAAGSEYATKACGPASFAMAANLFLGEPLSVMGVTGLMRERVSETDWPSKPTSRGFVPGVGTNVYGMLNFALDFPELEPVLFLDQDTREVQQLLAEYRQPVIVGTRVNWEVNRGGHLAVLRGFGKQGEMVYASVYDPYLYKMEAEDPELVRVGAYGLLVSESRFEAAFTGEVLVLNAGAPPYFDGGLDNYGYEEGFEEIQLMKRWLRGFELATP